MERYSEEGQGIQDAFAALEGFMKGIVVMTEAPADPKKLWFVENVTFWNIMHVSTRGLLVIIHM